MKKNQETNQDASGEIEKGKTPQDGKHYKIRVDSENYAFDHNLVTGKEILETAGKKPVECHTLYEKIKGHEYKKIELTETVDLAEQGVDHFKTEPPTEFCVEVDGEKHKTKESTLTPNEILEIAGLKPVANYYLILVKPNGEKVSYEGKPKDPIKMECPCMNFISVYVGPTPLS